MCIRDRVHSPLGFIAERPQSGDVLTVEIKFRGVLQTQYHRMRTHALPGLRVMRRHDIAPIDRFIAQEAVGGDCLRPAIARHRDAGRRLGRNAVHQRPRSFVQAFITQIKIDKLCIHPRLCWLGQHVTQQTRVDA